MAWSASVTCHGRPRGGPWPSWPPSGDGANEAAALRAADVGISVAGATAAARECADVILLRKDLTMLGQAISEGRRSFGNVIKYLKITISSNFGNVLSMLAASAALPFLPMRPLQVLAQNLCFDVPQLSLAFDAVDEPSALAVTHRSRAASGRRVAQRRREHLLRHAGANPDTGAP